MTGYVLAACVGVTRPASPEGGWTAIDKRPVDGPVLVTSRGLAGDEQADKARHGGSDQAVYAYAQEDADHWAHELGRDVPSGALGENLRTLGLDVSGAAIGERWRVGGCLLEVTAPRIPCRVFADFWDVPDLVTRFLDAGRPGAYLRVLEPGPLQAGDGVEVVARPAEIVSVAEVSRIRTRDHGAAARLLAAPALSSRLQAWARAVAGAEEPAT